MTALETALLDAEKTLARPQVRADLDRLHKAGLPLLDEQGEPTRHDIAETLLPGVLEVPGNTGLFGRLVASSLRVYDRDAPTCPADGTGAEVVAHQAADDLQAGVSLPLSWEATLLHDLAPLIPIPDGAAVHLAIMREPYMGRVAAGTKTIESRWAMDKRTPWHRVQAGDVVVFKLSGGPVLGWSAVERAEFHELGEGRAARIIAAHPGLGVDADFVATVADKRRVTLVHLWRYCPVEAAHVPVGKRDQRGWVVLRGRP